MAAKIIKYDNLLDLEYLERGGLFLYKQWKDYAYEIYNDGTVVFIENARRGKFIERKIEDWGEFVKEHHSFKPPKHENEEVHKKVIERLKTMTPEELLQSDIEAGIRNSDGSLTEPYRDEV